MSSNIPCSTGWSDRTTHPCPSPFPFSRSVSSFFPASTLSSFDVNRRVVCTLSLDSVMTNVRPYFQKSLSCCVYIHLCDIIYPPHHPVLPRFVLLFIYIQVPSSRTCSAGGIYLVFSTEKSNA